MHRRCLQIEDRTHFWVHQTALILGPRVVSKNYLCFMLPFQQSSRRQAEKLRKGDSKGRSHLIWMQDHASWKKFSSNNRCLYIQPQRKWSILSPSCTTITPLVTSRVRARRWGRPHRVGRLNKGFPHKETSSKFACTCNVLSWSSFSMFRLGSGGKKQNSHHPHFNCLSSISIGVN